MPTTFSFGAKSAPDKANTDTTKKEAAPSKPFVFASSSTSSSSGFNFSMSSNLKPELDQKLKLVSAGADSVNVAKKDEGKLPVTVILGSYWGVNSLYLFLAIHSNCCLLSILLMTTDTAACLNPFPPPFMTIVVCSLFC